MPEVGLQVSHEISDPPALPDLTSYAPPTSTVTLLRVIEVPASTVCVRYQTYGATHPADTRSSVSIKSWIPLDPQSHMKG